ncbi:polymeric immunoglobulin receptor-like isoform X5 [Girardinichthys multiradiatus]|uniref:polymeric immunoglobulin receptor-like isoform X5 n=1 Tax=Girardinichthys multiradiatus TaxID=208333 RepID=UPI001FAC6A6E|nr:polymeric immunoglobulin receptor-like isoform X5 [Girardinichthys multiradiatus]
MWILQNLLILCTVLSTVSSAAGLIRVFGYEGGDVRVSCPYGEGFGKHQKYLCKNSCGYRDFLIKSSEKNKTKYSIYDDKRTRVFTVIISDLHFDDAGKYWCGVTRIGRDLYTEVKLEVRPVYHHQSSTVKTIITTTPLYYEKLNEAARSSVSSAGGLIRVFGYESRDVRVSCPYGRGYEGHQKYLCKNDCGYSEILVRTAQKNKTKYSINDDKTTRIFTVIISDLCFDDAGTYWCGVTRVGRDLYTEVKLEVRPDSCCNTVNKIHSIEEGSASISCPYDTESVNNLMFVCRGNRPSTCLQQALITSNITQNGRFRLIDERKSRIFTLTISSLMLKDSGLYLCGVQRNSGLDVFSAVQLEVKEWCCVKTIKMSGSVGRPVTFQCPSPPQHHNDTMLLCKGHAVNNCTDMMNQSRFTLQNVSPSSFSVTITKLEAGDAGTYWCRSDPEASVGNYTHFHLSVDEANHEHSDASVFALFALPAVMLVVMVLVKVYKNKCHKK